MTDAKTETDSPVHPGVVLKEVMGSREMDAHDIAVEGGLGGLRIRSDVIGVMRGYYRIDDALAVRLERALGVPAQEWLDAQQKYDAAMERQGERGE